MTVTKDTEPSKVNRAFPSPGWLLTTKLVAAVLGVFKGQPLVSWPMRTQGQDLLFGVPWDWESRASYPGLCLQLTSSLIHMEVEVVL